MSAQFGTCSLDGRPLNREDLDKVRRILAAYGPDDEASICQEDFLLLYRGFHTTKESHKERQPLRLASGAVLAWDGRLDNRTELLAHLGGEASSDATDVEIVAGLYGRHGNNSLARLIGDWALSVWNPKERSLVLAKDCMGARHLYYACQNDQVTWSSILEALVQLAPRPLTLDAEYVAGWMSFFPGAHLTPYTRIHAVPPSSFVQLESGKRTIRKYWDLNPAKQICYRTNAEYEEHFRAVFAESVRRRLRSDRPVLAELSGGMDSSAIVCMADILVDRGQAETPRVDTISYYDDSEPNWNERPYFTKVEEKRGRQGWHINVSPSSPGAGHLGNAVSDATAGSERHSDTTVSQFISCLTAQNNRVVLSGTGGDEFTGGVPTPTPELADLLTRLQFEGLARQLKLWALSKRRPWFQLLWEVIQGFLPSLLVNSQPRRPLSWLRPSFRRNQRDALSGYRERLRLTRGSPSFQQSLATLNQLRRQLSFSPCPEQSVHETSYPYLDRDLIEFLCAIPCDQLVRPNQRRSLMRRSLVGIVPDEILNRKRKAFLVRSPIRSMLAEWQEISGTGVPMMAESLGFVDQSRFAQDLHQAETCGAIDVVAAQRVLGFEVWLRQQVGEGLLQSSTIGHSREKLRAEIVSRSTSG